MIVCVEEEEEGKQCVMVGLHSLMSHGGDVEWKEGKCDRMRYNGQLERNPCDAYCPIFNTFGAYYIDKFLVVLTSKINSDF